MRTAFTSQVREAAGIAGVDADLLESQVYVESGGNPWAWNPEPKYPYFWNLRMDRAFRPLTADEVASKMPPADFSMFQGDRDQEWWGQQVSWGLCQVMGSVARERGFKGPYLTELLKPEINLTMAAAILRDLLSWAKGDERQALAAYNGGRGGYALPGPQAYARKILTLRDSWRS